MEACDPLTDRADYSLYVATAKADSGELSGCLVGFVTQCSIRPARFLVCISTANHTYRVIQEAGGIALHLLGGGQTELASLFGEVSGDSADKFERCRWRVGSLTGSPVLVECAAWIEGSILDRFDVGDHQALLVEPLAGGPGTETGTLTIQHLPPLEPGHPAEE